MNRRSVGVAFCFFATILLSMHYLVTAIYLSNVQTWSKELFLDGLEYTGGLIDILSLIMFVIGIIYLLLAEDRIKNGKL